MSRIFAVDLTNHRFANRRDANTSRGRILDRDGEAVDESGMDSAAISTELQVETHRQLFHECFPRRSLKGSGLVVQYKRSKKGKVRNLDARRLTYKHLDPVWSRPDGVLADVDLPRVIGFFENERGEDSATNLVIWHQIRQDPSTRRFMDKFSRRKENESEVRDWFISAMTSIANRLDSILGPGNIKMEGNSIFGRLGVALAYTDERNRVPNNNAAYISKLDGCYFRARGNTPFCGIEFKYCELRENMI